MVLFENSTTVPNTEAAPTRSDYRYDWLMDDQYGRPIVYPSKPIDTSPAPAYAKRYCTKQEYRDYMRLYMREYRRKR